MSAEREAARRRELSIGPRMPGVDDSLRYRLMRAADRLIIRALFRVRVDGLEAWPEAPFCLVLNHHNGWDPLILIGVTPAVPRITWFGPREADFSRGFKNRVMAFFGGVVPFNPEKTTLTSATRAVRRVFEVKGVLGIFAEGHNGFREAALQPFEDGAVTFATMAGVPIVPCAVSGTTYLWLGKHVTVRFGEPIPTVGIRGAAARARLTEEVRQAILAMLPAQEPPLPGKRPLRALLTDLFHPPEEVQRRVAERGE
jgi:1-acyl-sn-glycerol-3-phosphate acyltransferase